jgi:hypothetical protein
MKHYPKLLITASIILITTITVSGCVLRPQPQPPSPTPVASLAPSSPQPAQTTYEFTATESGTIALDLVQSQATIETQDYGEAGKFITSINGVAGNANNYWAFYVNGAYAQAGASQTKLKKGDIIKFVYEAVAATK